MDEKIRREMIQNMTPEQLQRGAGRIRYQMSEELYNSSDYCSLAEQYEELKKENDELTADKIHLIQAAMDGRDRYHYTYPLGAISEVRL